MAALTAAAQAQGDRKIAKTFRKYLQELADEPLAPFYEPAASTELPPLESLIEGYKADADK